MQRADLRQMANMANMNLVGIRQAELDYFNEFFSNFGNMAAVISGSIVGCLSQTPTVDNPGLATYPCIFVYNASSAICLGVSCHLLLCTAFLAVFGQGLAIRGPVGSMVRAIDGMVFEQEHMILSFVFMIISYFVQMVTSYYVVMDRPFGHIALAFSCCFIVYTYLAAVRIFNRFWWDSGHTTWTEEDESEMDPLDNLNFHGASTKVGGLASTSAVPIQKGKRAKGKGSLGGLSFPGLRDLFLSREKKEEAETRNADLRARAAQELTMQHVVGGDHADDDDKTNLDFEDGEDIDARSTASGATGTMRSHTGSRGKHGEGHTSNSNSNSNNSHHRPNSSRLGSARDMGYLSVQVDKKFLSEPWERRYIVVGGSEVLMYKDKRTYDITPAKSITSRPINLDGYTLVAGAVEPPYIVTLAPLDAEDNRKIWKFRADTLPEFHQWIKVFSAAINAEGGNEDGHNDLMVITSTTRIDRNDNGEDEMRTVVESIAYK